MYGVASEESSLLIELPVIVIVSVPSVSEEFGDRRVGTILRTESKLLDPFNGNCVDVSKSTKLCMRIHNTWDKCHIGLIVSKHLSFDFV